MKKLREDYETYLYENDLIALSKGEIVLIESFIEHAKGYLNTPQWQTIETAPRDGTKVLCLTEEGKQRVDGMRKGKWWEMYPRDPYVYWQPLPQPPEDTE